ncbi:MULTISPECIES: winged helix-turn-helix domain-containing protein [Metallosphaera]|uniref:winged helix-turn-helix domain-containing protein n=1 Tax=Metallosphaera TaxID=41980 RepID=UPI001F0686BD|nr:winged helix-turn-helix domain-containing protein [Metallosphaera sedula]MCH1771061.1 winged helix-turn-helix domain-containing protein [Metallosphaera sedula]
MAKKRTTNDIIRDMLQLAQNGIRKTSLMAGARISFDLLKKYLSLLEAWNLIEEKDRMLYLTPKGIMALNLLNRLASIKEEEARLEREIEELIPVSEITPQSPLDRVKEILARNGISYREINNSVFVANLEICEENDCGKGYIFVSRPRVILGKKFLVYSDGKRVQILKNDESSIKRILGIELAHE